MGSTEEKWIEMAKMAEAAGVSKRVPKRKNK